MAESTEEAVVVGLDMDKIRQLYEVIVRDGGVGLVEKPRCKCDTSPTVMALGSQQQPFRYNKEKGKHEPEPEPEPEQLSR